jgi:hypothetical protein
MLKRHGTLLVTLTILLVIGLMPGATLAQTGGSGWTGQFYNTTTFTGSIVAIASYPGGLSFTWAGQPTDGNGIPLAGVNADNFSARFATSENFTVNDTYRFYGSADDQVRIYLDGIEVYYGVQPGPFSFERTITAGTHTLRVDLVELTSTAAIQLQWQSVSAGTPADPAPTQVIGHVVNVAGLSLRTGPYLGASRIGVLKPAIAYPVLGKNDDEGGGYTWYLVIAGDQQGWCSGRYFLIDGDVPETPSVFQEIDDAADVGVVAVPRAWMNFRVRPSIRSQRIGQIPWGDEAILVGRTIQGGENHWFQVRYNGMIGWIYAPYVGWRGNINSVPIR